MENVIGLGNSWVMSGQQWGAWNAVYGPRSSDGRPVPLSEVEREYILRTLRAVHGNKAAAARLLGLDRKTLYRKLELYGIRPSLPHVLS